MQFSFTNRHFKQIGLKKFLKHHGVSHRVFSAVKRHHGLFLNRQRIQASIPLKLGDQVTIQLPAENSEPGVLISYRPLNIIYEDTNWLVLNKPAGLTSVPGPSNRSDTAVNRIKGYLIQTGSHNLRPHLITRLDQFTSGLMLVARHRFANSLANQMLENHQIQKIYLALVSGQLKNRHGQIKMPIGKYPDEIRRHFMVNGQRALTEYWVVDTFAHFTEVRARLHTGRTHQIRVHFAEMGHPLLGDRLYGGPMDLGIRRHALHAYELSFFDPFTNRKLKFRLPLPLDMKRVIKEARHEKS